MVKEIEARVLLSAARRPDPWFGIRYTMNLYRGCQHQCIYCDSRSECYQIDDFTDISVKVNALDLLRKELASKRSKDVVGTGSMNDPYMPLEAERNLTGRALAILAQMRFPVHIITKSDLVLRDLDVLSDIQRVYAAVSITITTADDELCRKVEPGAPPASRRFAALAALAARGILAGVTMMPILPFIEDSDAAVAEIVRRASDAGARYILPAFSVTLRDRQRAYYYAQLDRLFPGLRRQYERCYGDRYACPSPRAARLEQVFGAACAARQMPTRMPHYALPARQLPLL